MKVLVTLFALVVFAACVGPGYGQSVEYRYWGGSQESSIVVVEAPAGSLTLRYQTMAGPYTADLPLKSDTARWSFDVGWPTGMGTAYVGYSELRHVQYGIEFGAKSDVAWLFQDVFVGVRGRGNGPLSVEYDVAFKPSTALGWTGKTFGFGTLPTTGRWFGYDVSVGVRWEPSPGTVVRAGFTDWKWTPEVHTAEHWDEWMQWSGPYLGVAFSW